MTRFKTEKGTFDCKMPLGFILVMKNDFNLCQIQLKPEMNIFT